MAGYLTCRVADSTGGCCHSHRAERMYKLSDGNAARPLRPDRGQRTLTKAGTLRAEEA